MGISNGMVAIYYDKGFLITEETDFSKEITTVPYDELMAGAIAILDQVISDCSANAAVSLPEGWLQIANLTLGDLGKIAHSFVARFKSRCCTNATGTWRCRLGIHQKSRLPRRAYGASR